MCYTSSKLHHPGVQMRPKFAWTPRGWNVYLLGLCGTISDSSTSRRLRKFSTMSGKSSAMLFSSVGSSEIYAQNFNFPTEINGILSLRTRRKMLKIHDGMTANHVIGHHTLPQIARFMGPTWGPSGSDRTQVGPMLATWTLLSGTTLKIIRYCAGNNTLNFIPHYSLQTDFRFTLLDEHLINTVHFYQHIMGYEKC